MFKKNKHFNTEHTAYYPDAVFERNDIVVKNGVAFECYSSLSYMKDEKSIIIKETAKDYAFVFEDKRIENKSVMDFLRSIS